MLSIIFLRMEVIYAVLILNLRLKLSCFCAFLDKVHAAQQVAKSQASPRVIQVKRIVSISQILNRSGMVIYIEQESAQN